MVIHIYQKSNLTQDNTQVLGYFEVVSKKNSEYAIYLETNQSMLSMVSVFMHEMMHFVHEVFIGDIKPSEGIEENNCRFIEKSARAAMMDTFSSET